MRVLVDTCIWSYALRKKKDNGKFAHYVKELSELIEESRVDIIGAIRQESLSGVKHATQFKKIKLGLAPFPDINVTQQDYELAAELFNTLRSKGIQGSNTDFLICAVSINHALSIFTDDIDFQNFKKHIPIHLHEVREQNEHNKT